MNNEIEKKYNLAIIRPPDYPHRVIFYVGFIDDIIVVDLINGWFESGQSEEIQDELIKLYQTKERDKYFEEICEIDLGYFP